MAVLSNVDIEKIVSKNKGIIITNMRENNLTALGYDFTIGFICNTDTGEIPKKKKFIRDTKSGKEYAAGGFPEDCQLTEDFEKDKKEGRYKSVYRYELKPGERYLVISEEYIALSEKYMATLHSRGSYALKGIIVTSTTIDPNYEGFVYASLFNSSKNSVYIKECNQFATMVIHTVITPTQKPLPQTERRKPKDAEQTLDGTFSNICEEAYTAVIKYRDDVGKTTKQEFQSKFTDFKGSSYIKNHFWNRASKIWNFFLKRVVCKKEFWFVLVAAILIIMAYIIGGMNKALEMAQVIW